MNGKLRGRMRIDSWIDRQRHVQTNKQTDKSPVSKSNGRSFCVLTPVKRLREENGKKVKRLREFVAKQIVARLQQQFVVSMFLLSCLYDAEWFGALDFACQTRIKPLEVQSLSGSYCLRSASNR